MGLADPQVVCKKGGSMEPLEQWLNPPLAVHQPITFHSFEVSWGISKLRDSFTMVFTQNSSILH